MYDQRFRSVFVWLVVLSSSSAFAKDAKDEDKNARNYEDHVRPILRKHCFRCHGDDRQKADLNLQSYATLLRGASAGKVVVAGRSGQSLIYRAITNEDPDARMPPKGPGLPKESIAVIREWIDGGLRKESGSRSLAKKRDLTFQPAKGAGSKPASPAMPGLLPRIVAPKVRRPLPILALDTSPWAPVAAVAAQEHVRLVHTGAQKELGRLAFPEGVPHVVRFSRDGALLLVAGGRPVESGRVVLFDVKSGKRVAEIGDEVDAVLAADLSPDQTLVALGGSGRIVKVYGTADGKLRYRLDKHTEWITALAFSPDGSKLASADRAGKIHLYDANSRNGGLLLTLAEHRKAVRALDWRSDSKVVASVGEDGRVIWWDVNEGWPAIQKTNAHPVKRPSGVFGELPNGVLAARFGRDGKLCTAGRDGLVRVWTVQGAPVRSFSTGATPIAVDVTHDGVVIAGDSSGKIQFLKVK
ncbi:MAG: c-type cytochrome domain-containing protein [Planctomycetota bacterium]